MKTLLIILCLCALGNISYAQSKGLLLMETCQKREADAIRAAGYTPVFQPESFYYKEGVSEIDEKKNCDITVNLYAKSDFSGVIIEYPIAKFTKNDDETELSIKEWGIVQGRYWEGEEVIKLEQLKSFMTDSMDYLNKVDKQAAQAMINMKNRILPKVNEVENLRSDFDDEIIKHITIGSSAYTIYSNPANDSEVFFTHEFSNKEKKAFDLNIGHWDMDIRGVENYVSYINISEIETLIKGYEFGYIKHKLNSKPRKCAKDFIDWILDEKTGKCYDRLTTIINVPTERGITKEKWEYYVYSIKSLPKSREAVINNLSNAYAKLFDVILKEEREKRLVRDKVREIIETKIQQRDEILAQKARVEAEAAQAEAIAKERATPKFIKD